MHLLVMSIPHFAVHIACAMYSGVSHLQIDVSPASVRKIQTTMCDICGQVSHQAQHTGLHPTAASMLFIKLYSNQHGETLGSHRPG